MKMILKNPHLLETKKVNFITYSKNIANFNEKTNTKFVLEISIVHHAKEIKKIF
jgi:hypothetical protein